MAKSFRLALAVALMQLVHPSTVWANDEQPNERAVAAGRIALQKFGARDFAAAYQAFSDAEAIAHSPVFVLYMARCKRELEQLLEARALFRSLSAEEIGAEAPEPFGQAVAAAQAELMVLESTIPSLLLDVPELDSERARITLDGRLLLPAELSAPILVEVGPHTLELVRDGQHAKLTIALKPSQVMVPVRLELPDAANSSRAVPVDSAAARPTGERVARRPESSPRSVFASRVPSLVAFSIGAAGLIVGATAGILAWQQLHQLDERCDGSRCPASEAPRASSARQLANISSAAFVAGGLGVGLGFGLWLLPAARPSGPKTASAVALVLGGRL